MRRRGPRRAWAVRGAAALVAAVAPMAGCTPADAPTTGGPQAAGRCQPLARSEPARARNVVFVLSDTMRRDRMGIHGSAARTPRYDAFAREGLWFTAATAPAPWTKPSVATLFTGLRPSTHGVLSHPALRPDSEPVATDALGDAQSTLAEALAAAGYQTAAFVANPWVQRALGFAQGFEVWDESLADVSTPGEAVTEAGLRWLRERPRDDRPYFLYLHYVDAHEPFWPVPPDRLAERRAAIEADARPVSRFAGAAIARLVHGADGEQLADQGVEANRALFELAYDVGVEHFDRALGSLLDGVAALSDAGDPAIVVTSDHGESLFERGWRSHGRGLYEEETGVPLAARLPGVATRGPIACPVGLIDLGATLCDYLGVSCPGGGQGTSLFSPSLADPERVLRVEGVMERDRNRAVRGPRYKLIYEPDGGPGHGGSQEVRPFRLYDMDADPGERHDLLAGDPDDASSAALARLRREAEAPAEVSAPADSVVLDRETVHRLQAMGYLQAPDEAAGAGR
ncbi:MAG TPA: sulfatase [Myxococcota bacterium]|nr:sulfatase [Myxococcota bacterium]